MGPETGPETLGPAALVGRVIGGYSLERVLGTGVTGAVLLGRRSDAPDHLAAIRLLMLPLQTPAAVRAEFRQALAREAHTLFALRHPHILRVYAFGEDVVTDFPYMVLPYMPGGSLAARLASGLPPLPLADVATQLDALADALDFAHGRGIVHGDIKPANVLYDAGGRVQLADFGIARLFETVYGAAATAGLAQGSAAYIAPEQALGEQVGPAADLYSLGVVLYQMVTGRVPFEGVSPTAVMLKHLQQPPPTPRRFRPDLPEPAEAVLLHSLAKEPSQRFPTAAALAAAFAQAIGGDAGAPAESAPAPAVPETHSDLVAQPIQTESQLATAGAPQVETPSEPPVKPSPAVSGLQAAERPEPPAFALSPAAAPSIPEVAPEPATLPAAMLTVAPPADAESPSPEPAPEASAHPAVEPPAQTEPVAEVPEQAPQPSTEPAPAVSPAERPEPELDGAVAPTAAQSAVPPAIVPAPADMPAAMVSTPVLAPSPVVAHEPTSPPATATTGKVDLAHGTESAPAAQPSDDTSWLTPHRVRGIILIVFFGVLALAAIALIRVVGLPQVLLMALILALLAFIVVAVPSHARTSSPLDNTPPGP